VLPLLEQRCAENKERIAVVRPDQLEQYKKENPKWRSQHPKEIGAFFKADYVIGIEVLESSIFETSKSRELLRGRAKISVTAFDMSKPLKEPDYDWPEFTFEFPRTHPVAESEESLSSFRKRFLKSVGADLVRPFTVHSRPQRVMVD
jgi:hypothetical protein